MYLRVSTLGQELENQRKSVLEKYDKLGLTNERIWIEEKITGKRHYKRRDLGRVLKEGKEGDVLITYHIDRLGRNKEEIFSFLAECKLKKITIYYSLMELKNDGSVSDAIIETMYALMAEIENKIKSERVKLGMQQAKSEGRIAGRGKGVLKLTLEKHILEIKKSIDEGVKLKALAEKYRVTATTISKIVSRHKLKTRSYEDIEKEFKEKWEIEKKKKQDQALAKHERIEARKLK
jgi:DNA invertase Pin-like site-specific DNA recombinase